MRSIHFLRKGAFLSLLSLSLLAIPGGGCGGGTSGGAAGSTDFEGTLAGDDGETGTISVTVATDVAALKMQTSGDVEATDGSKSLSGTFAGGDAAGTFSGSTTACE